jgi:cytochrome c oxidase subunit 1
MVFLGFMSFLVWAHHMFQTGMGQAMSNFFQITTMIISVPSVIILSSLFITLWGGKIRFNTPMLFAISFLPMFGIGGLTGLPLGLGASDIPLHDTYYVIGHFHYVVAPGTVFAILAGIYFWFPKITGKMLDERLGKIHFWTSFICMNGIFLPMFFQGIAGVSRRLADGGASYAHAQHVLHYNEIMSMYAWLLGLAQIIFIVNIIITLMKKREENVDPNPWRATTIEWTDTTSPPLGHGNFETVPSVYRGPYEYSVPGEDEDFIPQSKK